MSTELTTNTCAQNNTALVLHHGNVINHSPRGSYGDRGGSVNNNNFVIVELHRDDHNCPSFGFNIKGGIESGCPVYIWRVEPGSLADRSGLKSGDEIVQANGISFGGISHAEALKVLKGQTTLTLYIKAPVQSTPHNQRRPPPTHHELISQPIPLPPPLPPPPQPTTQPQNPNQSPHRVEYYTWVDRHGNPVPPPNPSHYIQNRLINLEISPGQNLGLMIRGGSEYGLGIYVTGVDPGSVAERVGLSRGDEILSVNNKNFTRITHDKAVQILKSSKRMQIVASYIGKIPADLHDGEDILKLDDVGDPSNQTLLPDCDDPDVIIEHEIGDQLVDDEMIDDTLDRTQIDDPVDVDRAVDDARALDLDFVQSGDGGGSGRCTTSILQMIEEKARTVLNKSEHSRFTFYRIEYMQGFLPVVAFVRILLELLNTHEKYTLLTEVRELIRPSDLSQFDELIYTKSTSFRVSSSSTSSSAPSQQQQQPVAVSAPAAAPCTNTRSIYDTASVPPPPPPQQQTANQQQQPAVPPQLPPPPQPPPSFIHHHQDMVVSQQPDEIIMDDFIEHPQNVIGGTEECCFGPGGTAGWGPQGAPQQRVPQSPFTNNDGVVARGNGNNDRQLVITHDPAALTMTPQITSTPGGTLPRTTPSSNIQTIQNTTALLTPNKLATAPTTPGGTLQQGVSNHVLPAPGGNANGNANSGSSSVPAVRFKVRISKVKPILGIAIEGGSNTPHRLPRIIDVNPDGSAFHSNLRAGQVLLTVDGKKLDGLTHEEIARLILDCYVDMTKSQIEFLVVEAKQNYYYFNSNQNI